MINNHFTPKFKEVYHEFNKLPDKPGDFNQLIEDVYFAHEHERRQKSFLELANWTLQQIGGRITEIKE